MNRKQETELKTLLTTAHHDHEKGLTNRAFFKLQDHTIGEELVQDTFLKTWVYLVKGGNIETMKAFLYHILNNLIIDEYRKHKTVSLDNLSEKGFEPTEGSTDSLFNFLDGKRAVLLIQNLPQKYKQMVNLRYVKELTIEEIAKITGQSKNTVAVQSHRGLAKLRLLYNRA